MKQKIRLTESQLYNVIRKCINEVDDPSFGITNNDGTPYNSYQYKDAFNKNGLDYDNTSNRQFQKFMMKNGNNEIENNNTPLDANVLQQIDKILSYVLGQWEMVNNGQAMPQMKYRLSKLGDEQSIINLRNIIHQHMAPNKRVADQFGLSQQYPSSAY